MLFMVMGYDGEDAGAPARREAVREAHLARATALNTEGRLIWGGGLLDDDESLIGSVLILDFEDRAAADYWVQEDPYVVGEVWQSFTVTRCRRAPIPVA